MKIIDPGTLNHTINEMYAVVTHDEHGEGIMGASIGGQWLPFVCAELKNIKKTIPVAQQICKETNKTFRVLRFSTREDVTAQV